MVDIHLITFMYIKNKGLRYLTEVNVSQAGACEVDGTLSRVKLYKIKCKSHGNWHEEQD